MSATHASHSPVLADLLPGSRVRDIALVLAGTVFVTVAGWISIPLWFTPVPLSLATFAVLLTGAALGPLRAGLSIALFMVLGMVGLPMFANQASGWAFASFGYIIGYLVAAIVVGALARRRADRTFLGTFGMIAIGSLIIYAFGLPWLMGFLGVDLAQGLQLGVVPFLVGDLIKTAAAALLLPATWKLVNRGSSNKE
ncbi:MAG: biotin transporter BioY [Candidatus Nanopelagicales bacterium]